MPETPQPNRVQRVRHELKRRQVTVRRVHDLSPHLRSITFGGDDLADMVSASFDDHVKFMLDADGAEPVRRDYTPRHVNTAARELTLEFALHGHGPAASWAAQAAPGQQALIGGPRGSFIVPLDWDWHLLVGDLAALPAIARRLEELPAGQKVTVIVQADPADQRALPSAAQVNVLWVTDAAACLAAVRALPWPTGAGYVWCAGEASAMAALREVLITEKQHDRHAMRVAAYWKRGAQGHHEELSD